MGINKVQFQKGLSMVDFLDRYGTEEKCHAAVVAQRWRRGQRVFKLIFVHDVA